MRKPLRFLTVLTILVMFAMTSLFLNGCASSGATSSGTTAAAPQDSAQTTAYKALRTAADTYDVTMKSVASLYRQGVINADVKDKAIQYGNTFRTAYNAAIDVMEAGGTPSTATVSAALADLLKFVQPYMRGKS